MSTHDGYHLLRVTIRILSHYRVADPDVACAALLHDAVEDHSGGHRPRRRPGRRPWRCWPGGSANAPPSRRDHQARLGARASMARWCRPCARSSCAGHSAGGRRQGPHRRPARCRKGAVHRDRARPPRQQRGQPAIRRPARRGSGHPRAYHRRKPIARDRHRPSAA
jgi:hypothetical protein